MSWAEEDWTVGLSGRVLQKVKELQVQQERLSRENKQKQLQLDNIHTSLEKQTVKYEEVRGELHSVQRELQSVREEAKAALISRERLAQELQTKQAQVCSFEGQLDAARTLNNKLTQEVKRLEAELEKLQNSSRPADTTLYSTPCWSASSPWEHNGNRKEEERPGRQDETQNRGHHIRQRLHFSDTSTASVPRQQQRSTPHRHPSDQSECFSTPMTAFPWERDDTKPTTRRQSPISPQTPCADVITQAQSAVGLRGKEQDHRTETDISQMQNRVSCLEEEVSEKTRMLKSTQSDLIQIKKDVTAREISLQKTRDELSLANTRMTQESERASAAEQRLKQLQEELRCQRQNTESSRLQHQQRTKDMEKQHQRDLSELQKERQWLEKQHQQEVNKLNQELQQARTLHNALQAQADKLSVQKQALDKELETLKEKLKWTEAQLQESQKKEAQIQAKLLEALREAEGVAVSLEQSRKRERGLEEEGRRLAEERADALRLLKDLQEQKTAPPPQIVQFCPVGQSFSPQPSHAPQPRLSAHTKRTTAPIRAEQRTEDMTEERAEITASYPSDREPGEGIDSEHISALISTESETLQREGVRRKSIEKDNMRRNEEMESDDSGTKNRSSFDPELFHSSQSAAGMSTNTSVDGSEKPEQAKLSEILQRENAMLRSEINDVREELQKRLEDLENQRRAEAEARTRLKQFSRRCSSQALEKEEQEKEWRTQLESERAETERLRKAVAALETEMKRRNEEGEKPEEEKNKALEDRENELIELNIQLRKQLSQVKAQLILEQEERMRGEEVRKQITISDTDEKEELRIKVEELEAEVEQLKRSREEEEKGGERLPPASSPLMYLTLHDDELNSVNKDNKLLPSPEQHLLFCRSTNQINMLVSQATADLVQQERALIDPKQSPQSHDGQRGQLAPDPEDYLGGSLPSEHGGEISQLQKSQFASDLEKEVKQLHKEKKREIERAKESQVKLEALQSQVTRQTQHLTLAFEKQSQHITGLLAELQEKESALLSQGEELQRCKQELEAFTADKVEIANQRQGIDEKPKTIELQPNREKDRAIISNTTMSLADEDAAVQTDEDQTKTDVETLTPLSEDDSEALLLLGQRRPGSVDSDKTESNLDSACVMEEFSQDAVTADMMSELLSLRQENQLLKQRIESFTLSEGSDLTVQANQEDPVKQSYHTRTAALSNLMEQRPLSVQPDTGGQESLLQSESRGGNEGDMRNMEEITKTEVEDEVSQRQIQVLDQQVVALQMKIQALSLETQQQTEELTLWRLASQSASLLDQNTPSKDNQDQNSAVKQLQASAHVLQESEGHVTIIREDELLLSDSSNILQGRMLFSSLQHSNLPEPKRTHLSKKTAALQEHNQDSAQIDEESEKENVLQWSDICPSQHKEERDAAVIRLSSEMTSQHFPKGPSQTKATENPMAKPNAPKMSSATNPASDSADMKSVGSQTEGRLYPTSPEVQCTSTQTEEEEEEEDEVESPPISPLPSSVGAGSRDKMLFAGSFPIPADPAHLAERIRRNRTQLSAAFDDTEYEPYGLPEVVMKGFADIPEGPSCPYIVRRGLLGTVVSVTQTSDQGQKEETD